MEWIRKMWCIYVRHTRKNSHLAFFIKGLIRCAIPRWFTQRQLKGKLNELNSLPAAEREYILDRVDYYCRFKDEIFLPEDATSLDEFTFNSREGYGHNHVHSTYFFDAYEYTRFFSDRLRWAYKTGDVNMVMPVPQITKSRPTSQDDSNRNNILLNLDKVRHFTWVHDPIRWEDKERVILFRGAADDKPRRLKFIEMWKDHPWCDLVSTGKMSLYDHLKFKYIMALEGYDVASNLKWVMSSNCIAVMPRPTCETWYMEGRLKPDYHYIEIAEDYHDLIDKIQYYEDHPEEAKAIIKHAHEWVSQFRNQKREDLISLLVLEKYFRLTKQLDSPKA